MPTLLSINGQPISFGGAVLSWPDAVPDVTAPTLAFSTLTATGATTASGTVTTYEADGTVYAYISTSGTPPNAATVKANGTSQAGGSAGVKTFNFTGLTANTLYSVYYVHTDAAGNDSAVANAADTTDVEELPAGFAYIWPTVTVESAPETTTGYRWKVRTPIGSGSYTTVKTTTPSVAIGTELDATTYHETYNAQFDGIVVAYNGDGESTSTYDPFQFYTAPSDTAPVLTASAVADTSNVDLDWTFTPNPANGGFIIFRDGVEIDRVAAAIRTYTDETSAAVTEYDYTVQPYNSNPDIEGTDRPDSLGVLSNVDTLTTNEAPIVLGWEASVGLATVGDSIVSTQGTLIEAVNLGESTDRTINGVVFDGQLTRNELDNAFTNADLYQDGVIGADFVAMMDSMSYPTDGAENVSQTITLTGLTNGETYLLQVFSADNRTGQGAKTQFFTIAGYVSSAVAVGTGYSRKCYFVATGSTQVLTIDSALSVAQLNAFQTRLVS